MHNNYVLQVKTLINQKAIGSPPDARSPPSGSTEKEENKQSDMQKSVLLQKIISNDTIE